MTALESESRVVLRTGLESPKPTQMLYAGREYRGLQWPVSEESGCETPVLYQESFPLGKANLIAPEFRVPEEAPDSEYPLWLVPGRVLLQRDRETRVEMEQGSRRNRIVREELVELSGVDASAQAILDGDSVRLETPGGNLAGVARISSELPAGMVAITGLFGQLAVDLQESDHPDPMSQAPGLHVTPARLVKVAE